MFVRAANPIWYFVDLVGLGLNDEYYAFFLTNTLPYLPQNVYRDPQGLTVWPNPLEFFPNGTLPDNLYFDPDLVYRIEIRHGNSQADPLIYEINNFVPNGSSITPIPSNSILFAENQVSNGQFADVLFTYTVASDPNPVLSIDLAGTYEVAPGWFLVLTGAGTTTVTQKIYSGDQNTSSNPNPPFGLDINNNGWTDAYLFQRFTKNGAIFANGAVSMSLTGRSLTSARTVTLLYVPSVGTPLQVAQGSLATGNFQSLTGTINVCDVANNQLNNVAYVDMQIVLPTSGEVEISDVQMVGQSTPIPGFGCGVPIPTVVPEYQQITEERTIDHLFHYYKSQLVLKPKKSILTGWNFPLNPFQFSPTALTTITAVTSYIADQTILHQEGASQLQAGEADVAQREGLAIKAVNSATATRFALIQYIDPNTVRPYWSYIVSALARVRIFTSHNTQVRLKARLIYRSTLPNVLSAIEPIASWPAGDDPVFSGGWTAIEPLNDPAYILPNTYEDGGNTAPPDPTSYPAFSFDQFQLPDADNASMTLGIVIYTMDNLDSTIGSTDSIVFDKISLIPSLFGADAFPQSFDECLRECQYYYETSYNTFVASGIAADGAQLAVMGTGANGGNIGFVTRPFEINYKVNKRAAPILNAVSGPALGVVDPTTGAGNAVHGYIRQGGAAAGDAQLTVSTLWTTFPSAAKNCITLISSLGTFPITGGAVGQFDQSFITFHYNADARLGV